MTRGVLYIVWPGQDSRVQAALERSIASVALEHPELAHEVIRLPEGATLLDKAKMLDLSPFDSTLFLDADTVVLGSLEHGFRKAEQHGLALCICECPWARRFTGLTNHGDIQEWNTGVMFFTRGAAEVFDAWKRNAAIDSSLLWRDNNDGSVKVMEENDQAAFALAVEETGFAPWVLPLNFNFRPTWQHTAFGDIRIWHDYSPVPDNVLAWNSDQTMPGAVLNCGRLR